MSEKRWACLQVRPNSLVIIFHIFKNLSIENTKMSRRDVINEVQKWKKMQKEGGRQVYENYIRKENQVTLESRIVPWMSAHSGKPKVDKTEMVVEL